jgi:hypothetical protein
MAQAMRDADNAELRYRELEATVRETKRRP